MVNVYIFGGEKRDYLPMQVELIEKYVKDLGNTFYIQGPYSGSQIIATQKEFVPCQYCIDLDTKDNIRTGIKTDRLARTVEYVLEDCEDKNWCLFLHGDCFIVDDFDVDDIVQGGVAALANNQSCTWVLAHPKYGVKDPREMRKNHKTRLYTGYKFILPEGVNSEMYYKNIWHIDDYRFDSEEDLKRKVGFVKDMLNPISTLRLGWSYLVEQMRWQWAGRPMRSKERVEEIFKICEGCPAFDRTTDDSGDCSICGCGLKKNPLAKFNKIGMATTACPYYDEETGVLEPKWSSDIK